MLITIPMQAGTVLANVRYYWLVGGVEQPTLSSGITQPDATFPLFVFNVTPPANADEIVAFDTSNFFNWNVGQYKTIAGGGIVPGPPVVITIQGIVPPGLRTVSFRSVYDSVLRRHGLDPIGDAITHDTLRAVTQHINTRVDTAWTYWEWPQLTLLQKRAFRTTWTNTLLFYRVNADGNPDELYDTATDAYYQVIQTAPGDPPAGTLPTNTTYFQPLAMTDRYIMLDQVNQTSIGQVLAVFDTDPRVNTYHYARKLPFQPTEREIFVKWPGTGTMVWVYFTIPASQFTAIPFVVGKTYAIGDRILQPSDGECYAAIVTAPTGDPVAQPTQWQKIPFPALFRKYVVAGAYADGLRETDISEPDPVKLQVRNTKIQIADSEAESYLQQEVDRLVAEGQVFRYGNFAPYKWWNMWGR